MCSWIHWCKTLHIAGTCAVLGMAGVPIAESVGAGSGFFSVSSTP